MAASFPLSKPWQQHVPSSYQLIMLFIWILHVAKDHRWQHLTTGYVLQRHVQESNSSEEEAVWSWTAICATAALMLAAV